jgi:hypothetical protein
MLNFDKARKKRPSSIINYVKKRSEKAIGQFNIILSQDKIQNNRNLANVSPDKFRTESMQNKTAEFL